MQVTNTLAYYDAAIITAVKSFIVQAPGCGSVQMAVFELKTCLSSTMLIWQHKLERLFLTIFGKWLFCISFQ